MSLLDEQEYVRVLQDAAHLKIMNMKPEERIYDPQGRILVEVKLPDDVYKEYKKKLTPKAKVDSNSSSNSEKIARHKITPITLVSFDVFSEPSLKKEFLDRFKLHEDSFATHRGSIIALQHEFYFHMQLVARTYHKLAGENNVSQETMENIHQQVMLNLGKRIERFYEQALSESGTRSKTVDEIALIQKLDKGRKALLGEAHDLFAAEVVKQTGKIVSAKSSKQLKHLAETTPATENDVLYIDESMNMANWIGGSKVTAHDRGVGSEHLADRRIINIPFNADRVHNNRLQIRIPSLDVKAKVTAEEAIQDVSKKLEHLAAKYQISQHISFKLAEGLRAFTYNLHTALNDNLEGAGNKQSQGARYILEAAHRYNRQQMNTEEPLFCWVQNISVNGFGDELGYGPDPLQREATLMTEFALAYNNAANDENFKSALQKYQDYLKRKDSPAFFSQSEEGKEAIKHLQTMKTQLRSEKNLGESVLRSATQDALRKVLAFDLHIRHDYAKLIQALSIFSEEVSLSGCKSGNERAQAINGRVAILDKAAQNEENSINQLVKNLGRAKTQVEANRAIKALKLEVDKQYDHHLQGGMALVSMIDQGAAAKVIAKNGLMGLINRNSAEEKELKHLHQNSAGRMQAHKGMAEEMTRAATKAKAESVNNAGKIMGTLVTAIFAPFILIGLAIERIYKAISKSGDVKVNPVRESETQVYPPQESYQQMQAQISEAPVSFISEPAQGSIKPIKEYEERVRQLESANKEVKPSTIKQQVAEEKGKIAQDTEKLTPKSVEYKEALQHTKPDDELGPKSASVSANGSM